MLVNGIKLKTDINLYTYEHLIFFIKKPEIHTREKTAFSTHSVSQTGWLCVEESKKILTYYPEPTSKTFI